MRRAIFYVVQLVVLIAAAVWLTDNAGEVVIDWLGYHVETYFSLVLVLVGLVAILASLAYRFLLALVHAPGGYFVGRRARRRAEGYRALVLGMASAEAGDRDEARRLSRRADGLLREPDLTCLLSAQAALLNGDEPAARRDFNALARNSETAFLGLIGLMRQAVREGDRVRALEFAEQAHRLRPDSLFVVDLLLDLRSRAGHWRAAQATLTGAVQRKLKSETLARAQQTTIFTARGLAAEEAGEISEASEFATKALAYDADFVPAICLEARACVAAGKVKRAIRRIEESWARTPHPELAAAYVGLWSEDGALARMRRVERLTAGNPDHPESRFALAQAALDAKLWGEARKHLTNLVGPDPHDKPDDKAHDKEHDKVRDKPHDAEPEGEARDMVEARACRLMARLERSEKDDVVAACGWLERAVKAPADAGWTCQSCGATGPEWSVLCGQCGEFGRTAWKRPPRNPPAA